METRRFTAEEIGPAADIIRRGGLLGIPTETVYGLGANGLDPAAVRRIFEAKGRPQDNPLILHVPAMDWLERYCKHIPAAAYTLAERFWPGPLTMILERREMVPDVTTAGLDTVGMRCPDHPGHPRRGGPAGGGPLGEHLGAAQPHQRRRYAGGYGR